VRSNVRGSVACELARAREERKAALTCNHGALLIACEDARVKCSQVGQVKPRAEACWAMCGGDTCYCAVDSLTDRQAASEPKRLSSCLSMLTRQVRPCSRLYGRGQGRSISEVASTVCLPQRAVQGPDLARITHLQERRSARLQSINEDTHGEWKLSM